ncbi:MAG: UbiA family prenyltransferase [Deltaproteobacteria bacterium]|nr:UbiA family prenyltransferase [Deltaproteobacteria bacterium]
MARDGSGNAAWRALRPHQWTKSALLFAPLLLAHQALTEPARLAATVLAAACFSAVASAGYLLNDWLDRESDRLHPDKRHRPLASGDLSPGRAGAIFGALLVAAFTVSWLWLPLSFTGLLVVYLCLTTAYSTALKKRAVLDVLVLAALYTLRVLAGGEAAQVVVSHWLLVFSMFFFMSLAFVKRYSELLENDGHEEESLAGRGYRVGDVALVPAMGLSCGFVSILVIGLWASSPELTGLYRQPALLWLACPVLFYWLTRVWLLAHRRELHSDPVLFAARDRASYLAGAALGLIGLAAKWGGGA